MSTEDYKPASDTAWCAGCGNFGIRDAVVRALDELRIEPWQAVFVSGISQAAKLPQYIRCNVFDVLHGRGVCTATGVHLANHKLKVIVESGDGDIYSEGTNHLMHAMRRNVNLTCLVHNNQIYGLTKGQVSPTSDRGFKTGTTPEGNTGQAFNPIAFAIAMEAGYVARGFAGDPDKLAEIVKQAIQHNGFALVDILQPCVTFNKVNTFQWYKSHVYYLDDKYDPTDQSAAFGKSLEWGDRIPCGIIYRNERPSLESQIPQIQKKPLVEQSIASDKLRGLIESFR